MKKLDRRIERTITALRDALMALIVEQGYDSITIQDITNRANVARATFYLHFKDKDDLMFSGMKLIYDQLADSINANSDNLDDFASPQDFLHVAQYADFYAAMLSPRGSMGFLVRTRAYLQELTEPMLERLLPPNVTPRIPLSLMAAYCAGIQISLIWWWVENRMPIPPEEMGRIGLMISLHGLSWATGTENEITKPC